MALGRLMHRLWNGMLPCLAMRRHIPPLFGLIVCLGGLPVWAQTNEEVFREFQFDFSLPGARAAALGGAFIGTADDASASYANPAGLAFLAEPAITLEYRLTERDGREAFFLNAGNTSFTQEAVDFEQLNFFAANYRFGSWYFGAFQYRYLQDRQNRDFVSSSFTGDTQIGEQRRISLDLSGDIRGLGVARRYGDFKLGATLNWFELVGRTSYGREGFEQTIGELPETFDFNSSIDDTDHAFGWSIGLLHEVRGDFTWGLVYRSNPKLFLQEQVSESRNGLPFFEDEIAVPFAVPDVFGGGVQYRVLPTARLMLDWQRIFYSQIIGDDFAIVENVEEERVENYVVDDIDQFHLGFEYLIAANHNVWAVRGGYFRNPRHTIRYRGDDERVAERFSVTGLGDEDHATVGFGWVWNNRFEIDLAADLWSTGREVTLSVIWRKK
ncbi:Outer membrane protein transport protein [Acanthopleuribacter pedis]